jgi:hypothetical protein
MDTNWYKQKTVELQKVTAELYLLLPLETKAQKDVWKGVITWTQGMLFMGHLNDENLCKCQYPTIKITDKKGYCWTCNKYSANPIDRWVSKNLKY